MSEALSDDAKNTPAPDPDARRVSPPGFAPAWEPVDSVQPPIERHVMEAARGLAFEPDDLAVPSDARALVFEFEEHENRNRISGTAERIGTAVGSAQRQVRRGLQLVSSGAAQLSHIERDGLHRATSTLHNIGGEVAGMGHQAARRLDEWSAEAGEHLQQFRREMSAAPSRWRARVQRAADQYPLQTIAAIAGVSFALGVALRLGRRSHRG
jgi:ElaB/YqjD/DUF883 family membrane-anchored ribosome-binding protein